jgi:hypothetical protein
MTAHHEDGSHEVVAHLIRILREITADWDVLEISPETRLDSLGLESINLVYFVAEVQQTYHLQDRLVGCITAANRPLADLRVAEIAHFVQEIRRQSECRPEEV